MYKVYKIDTCFEDYTASVDYVGGESVQDILDHFDEIYQATEIPITEDIIDEYLDEDPNLKVGDTLTYPYFEEDQLEKFKESLDPENQWKRIEEVPHLFTDTPYEILDGFTYME